MMLRRLRRTAAPVALVTFASFFLAMAQAPFARAREPDDDPDRGGPAPSSPEGSDEPQTSPSAMEREALRNAAEPIEPSRANASAAVDEASAANAKEKLTSSATATSLTPSGASLASASAAASPALTSLPTGADKTGVSSQAISVPSSAGKIQGMGESFSAQLSTGIATFNVPIALPAARGAAQPSLSLSYSSASGHGIAGVGWSIGVPFIARQTDRGIPMYDDPARDGPWHPEQDRFVFNGGQELVPICQLHGKTCDAILPAGEEMPDDMSNWQYFRPRVEGSFQRFFWSPDHKTWRVQDKSGVTMELGVPFGGTDEAHALEVDPNRPERIYRWNLVREYDAHVEASPPAGTAPRPVNLVSFRYTAVEGEAYLTDIYDTPPATSAATAALVAYAHHTHLTYELRPDTKLSYRRGWQTAMAQRLIRIDVTSKTFAGAVDSPRHLVRRYHLTYDRDFHVSLLKGIQVEGRCDGDEEKAPAEGPGEVVGTTSCPRLPPMIFDYQHVLPFDTKGNSARRDLPGYEGFDERIHTMTNSPDYSVDEEQTDLFDINSDALPDVLVTAPGFFGNKHGVFFNGALGTPDSFGRDTIEVAGVLGATSNDITLKNLNLSPQDVDGDGTIDLLHMPQVKTYSVYTPQELSSGWTWVGRAITAASQQSPKIDFGRDTLDLKVMDVNADGLVDVVLSGGTEFQTFFALGRYPGGDGQFGHASWTSSTTADISNDPIRMCVPWDSTPVRFSDSDIKLADMNGDGLVDIVRVRKGDIRYWPGRGNGLLGTGRFDDCPASTFGQARNIPMTSSPQFSDIQGDSLRLDDVNGDGLDDLVQVRFDGVDVWLNVDGTSWTERHIINGTPASPSFANRVRLVDVNGSGTRDILWGDGLRYKYIDLDGGQRPWVLTHVANGLGKTIELEYTTSKALMLADEAADKPWASKAPLPLHVVKRVSESDHLGTVGRSAGRYVTEYAYRDAVYDGRQREFRGFRHAESKNIGDDNSPTSTTATDFLLGECKDEKPGDDIDPCSASGSWLDSGREPLKGLPVLTETFDENRVYLSIEHRTYTLRHLYTGLDGRSVRHAFESATDTYPYDTGPFVKAESSVSLDEVVVEAADRTVVEQRSVTLRSGTTKRAHLQTSTVVDRFGNRTTQIASGCREASGCPDGIDEVITNHTEPARPDGDRTGWLWRTGRSFVTGDQHAGVRRNENTIVYNAVGDPIRLEMVLSGTLPLDRHHEIGGAAVAPAPPSASQGVDAAMPVFMVEQARDQFGNITFAAGANARCREAEFDESYAQLATKDTVFAGAVSGACGSIELASTATYDRGLAAVSLVHDLHGEVTIAAYDGLGRPVSITKPDPDHVGMPSSLPSMKIEYLLTTDANARPYSLVHTQTQDGASPADPEYQNAWAYVDGFGRVILTLAEADPTAGDGGDFIVNGLTEYDNKGAERRKYLAFFYDGDPMSFPLAETPPSFYGSQRYDAFGRQLETYGLDGMVTLRTIHHALSSDLFDAADILPGPHQGTLATTRKDGHGRDVAMVERIHAGAAIEARETRVKYLPTGEPEVITRVGMMDAPVVRWMRYDSQGRLVLNVEPNTSAGFNADPRTDPSTIQAWRYAYNDAGDLVGTSDARGCGTNYHYESAGRLTGEDYSPCLAAHGPYTPADPVAGTGFEVLRRYDFGDADSPPPSEFACDDRLLLGRLASVSDRASKTVTCYDGRGRATTIAKRIAKPDATDGLADRYAPRWYVRTAAFDGGDRPTIETTGAKVPELLGLGNASQVATSYTRRGSVKDVRGSYGTLVAKIIKDADALTQEIQYGDLTGTTTSFSYDNRRRLSSVQTYRGPPQLWTTSVPLDPYDGDEQYAASNRGTFQLLLQDKDFVYDSVDNPVEIRDWRIPD